MFIEINYKREPYMYTATLSNGETIIAFEDGTARSTTDNKYKIVTHLDETEEVIVDGWELINN